MKDLDTNPQLGLNLFTKTGIYAIQTDYITTFGNPNTLEQNVLIIVDLEEELWKIKTTTKLKKMIQAIRIGKKNITLDNVRFAQLAKDYTLTNTLENYNVQHVFIFANHWQFTDIEVELYAKTNIENKQILWLPSLTELGLNAQTNKLIWEAIKRFFSM